MKELLEKYKIGKQLQTICGMRTNGYTITELEKVTRTGSHAVLEFEATDFNSKKTKDPFTGQLEHKKIAGWVDAQGRWYN